MQEGGCHPVDGCYFPDEPYAGADFPWLAANVVKKDGSGTAAARHLGQGDRRHQGRLHRDDPRGHADARQPRRRLDRRLQGRGRDGQRPGGGPQEAGRQGDRRAHARGRPQRGHVQPVRRHLRPHRDDGDPVQPRDRPDHHRSHPRPLHLLHPRPGRQPAPGHELGRPGHDGHRDLARHQHAQRRGRPRPHHRRRTTSSRRPWPTTRRRRPSSPSGTPSPVRSRAQVVGTHVEPITGDSTGDRGIETPMADLVADAILYNTKSHGCPDRADERRWRASRA